MTLPEILQEIKWRQHELDELIKQLETHVKFQCFDPTMDLTKEKDLLLVARISEDISVLGRKVPRMRSERIEKLRQYILDHKLLGEDYDWKEYISLKSLCSIWGKVSSVPGVGMKTMTDIYRYLRDELEVPVTYFVM